MASDGEIPVKRLRGLPVRPLAERFWEKVHVSSGCWIWLGSRKEKGYGSIGLFGNGHSARAHRVAWLLSNGEIPIGLCVLHRCDTPACVNLDHLWLGTNFDNTTDMISKNRKVILSGERNGRARLTREQVAEIRHARLRGATYQALADQYGVSRSAIQWVITGRHWRNPDSAIPPTTTAPQGG